MDFKQRILTAVVAGSLSCLAHADGIDVKPGKWEFKSTSSLPTPGGPRENVKHECITESQIKPDSFMQGASEGCKLIDSNSDGNSMTWNVNCSEGDREMTGVGSVSGSGETLSGKMEMQMSFNGQQMNMDMSWDGKYVGPCD